MDDDLTNPGDGSDTAPDVALALLQAWLAAMPLAEGARLPPERALAAAIGLGRGALRRALATLEAEGRIWRHVGRGTFLGPRPAAEPGALPALAGRLGPAGVLQARLVLEPALARAAALAGTAEQLAALPALCEAVERAPTWQHYAVQDAALHRAIATAAGNPLLLHLFDQAEAVHRSVMPPAHHAATPRPGADHHGFAAHRAIVSAITARDAAGAERAMRSHLAALLASLDP